VLAGASTAWASGAVGTGEGAGAEPTTGTAAPVEEGASDRDTTPGVEEAVTTSAVGPSTPALARFDDLVLHLPSPTPVVVGFHEAATTAALGLHPVGTLTEDRNTTRTDLPADVPDGTPYLVLSSRGRAAAPTSAMDVVLEPGDPVLSPVTGTVVDVRGYLLYGAHTDLRVEVVPDERPDLRLVLIHLDEVTVEIGDRVLAGATPLAGTARSFPFGSHIDRETEPDRYPHVHLELKSGDDARPGDAGEGEDEAPETDRTAADG
jgi:hypothetical protein